MANVLNKIVDVVWVGCWIAFSVTFIAGVGFIVWELMNSVAQLGAK